MRLIILIFLITSGVYAQNSSFSVKGGLNYSTLEYGGYDKKSEEADTSYIYGGVLYLSWEKRDIIWNNIYLNIDFGINQKGTSFEQHKFLFDEKYSYDDKFLTLELPVILGYKFLNTLSLYFGGYLSLGFYKNTSNNSAFFFILAESSKLIIADVGLMFGLEYEHDSFLFNFRFQQGFTELYPPDVRNGLTEYYANSRQFVFMLGYRF